MAASADADDILSRLKFRVVQPVDIPRCHQLETLSFTADQVSSISELQLRQHHAAPFFRCALLKKPTGGVRKERHALSLVDDVNDGSDSAMPNGSDEACHHSVHGTSENELIGYICGTRCHDFAPDMQKIISADSSTLSPPLSPEGREQSPPQSLYPYSTKHEPHGPFLAIHSLVVQQEYRNLGVARAMLENYFNAIEILNGEVDEAGINRRRNKLKGAKTKIQKIVLLTNSRLMDFFVSMGFRWKKTLSLGAESLYELERDVRQSPVTSTSQALMKGPSSQPTIEPECYLVDSFANLRRWGSGNSAAIVLLQGPPSKLIADIVDDNQSGMWGTMKEQLNDILLSANEDDEQELANARADVWMHYVAKEFNQPATAFVWKLDVDGADGTRDRCWSEGASTLQLDASEHSFGLEYDSVTDLQSCTSDNQRVDKCEIEYYTRFMSRAGIEVDMCAHATLAAASVLFRKYASAQNGIDQQDTVLTFHSRKGVELKARHAPPSPLEEEFLGSQIVTNTMSDNIRIAMDYPWRSVDPLSQEDQSSVISLLRRAFFGAWSVVPPEEDDDDNETDGLAFSLKVDDVLYIGLTEGGEDLLIELTVEAFDLLCSRSVDYGALKQTKLHTRGIIICCEIPDGESTGKTFPMRRSEGGDSSINPLEGLDFRSRYFEPKIGVNEDPVSGWPHCALGPYFGVRRKKDRLFGLQESDRTGLVECVLKEDEKRVCIIGNTVVTVMGRLQMQF